MAASMATDLRPMYKKLMRLAKSLAEPKRQSTIDQIRTEFRTQRDVSDPKEISSLLQRAQSSIGYLKIVTPRASSARGVKNYIYKNGKRVEATSSTMEEGARYKTVDMEGNMRRHTQLLRRQHFMDRR